MLFLDNLKLTRSMAIRKAADAPFLRDGRALGRRSVRQYRVIPLDFNAGDRKLAGT
jgi:hypothetical protein